MPAILRPDEVKAKYGPMFCRGFYTMVDEENGIAQIVEVCSSRGPAEWDIVNRRRTGGIIKDIDLDGQTLIMDVDIGGKELRFGPVSANLGGQGVSSLKVEGDRVRTAWKGLAGASVGIGACIPQCPDVIETVYPDDFKLGGAHAASVEIVTPKMVRLVIGIDDTDTKEKGATWVVGMKLGMACPYGKFIEHKIIQLNPDAPNKTTNCCSTAISFAATEEEIPKIVEFAVDFVRKESYSEDAVVAVYKGLKIPKPLSDFGWSAKTVLYERDTAIKLAEENGVQIVSVTGMGGVIGAVAAIGCFDMGVRSAGVPSDFE
jgi:methanogenesis imperfect marker protein 11